MSIKAKVNLRGNKNAEKSSSKVKNLQSAKSIRRETTLSRIPLSILFS